MYDKDQLLLPQCHTVQQPSSKTTPWISSNRGIIAASIAGQMPLLSSTSVSYGDNIINAISGKGSSTTTWDLTFSWRWWLWRVRSSRIWRSVVWKKFTDVSEERSVEQASSTLPAVAWLTLRLEDVHSKFLRNVVNIYSTIRSHILEDRNLPLSWLRYFKLAVSFSDKHVTI
jgi:hypothetical protein